MIPLLGEQGAAALHEEMTRSILKTAESLASTDGIFIEVHYDGESIDLMRSAFGKDYAYIPQTGKDLGERMLNSFSHCLSDGAHKVVIIGADCPGITESILRQAFALLDEKDCVIGPSRDGGYYLIGLTRLVSELFTSIPWGGSEVLKCTLESVNRLRLRSALLRKLTDIDLPEALPEWEEKVKASSKPMISIIIPALNESDYIEKTVKHAQQGMHVEVIVADGGSTDRTRMKAELLGTRVVRTKAGRGAQMNEGASNARGDILLFLHADTQVPDGYDELVRNLLFKNGVIAGAFNLGFEENTRAMRIIAMGANARSRYLKMPYGDQGFFLRKDTFLDAGGFMEIPIMEDVALVRKLKSKGLIVISRENVITSSRRYQEMGPMKTWILNQLSMAAFYLKVPLDTIAGLYRSRETSIRTWLPILVSARKEKRGRYYET
jgi:uncharacterized protein